MMTKNLKSVVLSSLLFGSVSILATGCLGDKTQQQYDEQQANDYYQQIQAVAGNYKGTVTSSDGKTLGALTIEIDADKDSQKSADNLGTDTSANVDGAFTYTGQAGDVVISYTGATYDPSDRSFTASGVTIGNNASVVSATDGSSQTAILDVSGTISNGVLAGTIQVVGNGAFKGSFSLPLNGALPTQAALASGLVASPRLKTLSFDQEQVYEGTYPETYSVTDSTTKAQKQVTATDTMQLGLTCTASKEQQFADIFSASRSITVRLTDGDQNHTAPYPEAVGTIEDATDSNQSTLNATIMNDGFNMQLNCNGTRNANGQIQSWSCTKTVGGVKSNPILVNLQPAAIN